MNTRFVGATTKPNTAIPSAEDLAGLEPIRSLKSRWPMVIAGLLTAAMIVGLARQLLGSGLAGLSHAVPTNPLYYIAFALLYFSPPTGDFVIFRRLWRVPFDGFVALVKKRIANEVVFGYSGDAYFYAWARQNTQLVAAPFGAVKDVTILSAMAGNAMTLIMTALALPFAYASLPPQYTRGLVIGIPVVIAMCLPFLLFSRRVFSLDRGTLWWIFAVHCGRLSIGCLMIAFAWHFALPGVGIGAWLVLSAARMLVSRLPFVPNKELVFATVAIGLLGEDNQLSSVMAFTAAATLLVHIVLAGGFTVQGLIRRWRPALADA
jgi:hypothetical protein